MCNNVTHFHCAATVQKKAYKNTVQYRKKNKITVQNGMQHCNTIHCTATAQKKYKVQKENKNTVATKHIYSMQHCNTLSLCCNCTEKIQKYSTVQKENKNTVQNSYIQHATLQHTFIVLQLYRKKNTKYRKKNKNSNTIHCTATAQKKYKVQEENKNTVVTKQLYTACNTATHFHCAATAQKKYKNTVQYRKKIKIQYKTFIYSMQHCNTLSLCCNCTERKMQIS